MNKYYYISISIDFKNKIKHVRKAHFIGKAAFTLYLAEQRMKCHSIVSILLHLSH